MQSRAKRRARLRRFDDACTYRRRVASVLTALAIVASGAVIACGDMLVGPDKTPPTAQTAHARGNGPLTVENVGAYHNAFLDFSFPKVRDAIRNGADHARACKVIAQAMREFVVANRLGVDPRGIGDDIAGTRCSSRERAPKFSLADDGTTTPEFDAVIAEMTYAVDAGQSVAELSALFDSKVAYARANFPDAEAEVIAAAASVGLSSVEYWDSNYTTQYELLAAERDAQATYNRLPVGASTLSGTRGAVALAPPNAPVFWRAAAIRVGGADLRGAIHGGISGIRGGWAGVLAGAVIEGGGKSAGALIAELFK